MKIYHVLYSFISLFSPIAIADHRHIKEKRMLITIIATILFTSLVSGIIGMGGGMILMGVLSILLPVKKAMILHGVTQFAANGSRAYIHRKHIHWQILPTYIVGALLSFAIALSLSIVPSKEFILTAIGLFAVAAVLLPRTFPIDIQNKKSSLSCGFIVTFAQIFAGASGPVVDIFMSNSSLKRHEVIATKAITQTLGHLIKLAYYGTLIQMSSEQLDSDALQSWFLATAVISACAGSRLGKCVLDKLSEGQFRQWSRFILLVIGLLYLVKGFAAQL